MDELLKPFLAIRITLWQPLAQHSIVIYSLLESTSNFRVG